MLKPYMGSSAMGKIRRRQHIGYLLGLTFGLVFILVSLLPGQEKLVVRGPMNVGHENLSCQACHWQAKGTVRQQIQANTKYVMGLRDTPVDFGYQDVGNSVCLDCHQRPNDRHPVFRFLEPRFVNARKAISPQFCLSCHLEHTGQRINLKSISYCLNCHENTRLDNDPITIPHAVLIKEAKWNTCLGCHDYHGNHVMKTELQVSKAHDIETIQKYFLGGPSPYSDILFYQARDELTDE